jgi:hypothetical protein
MRDITNLMDHYRIVARSIWNTGFWPDPELRNWDSWEQFEQIKKLLFIALVAGGLEEIGGPSDMATTSGPTIRVVPFPPERVPIMIHLPREGDRNWYWDDPVREVAATEAELHFLDYFDWDKMNYVDFRYYRVRIASFASRPHLLGREALLEHQHAKVFVSSVPR